MSRHRSITPLNNLLETIKGVLDRCNCFPSRRSSKLLDPVLEPQAASPPWPPQAILDNRVAYMSQLRARPPRAMKGTAQDTPLNCLYRIYERLILDDTIGYRNEIEYFWWHKGWPVAEIPDPRDPEPARYAFLAAIPSLLVYAFNSNIETGLARYTPAILSNEEVEILQNTPEELKRYESVPDWTSSVNPIKKTLIVPIMDGPYLIKPKDNQLDRVSLRLNIRLAVPHILFT